jgi:N-carbamoylputrescine amidase
LLVGLVQHKWREDTNELLEVLHEGIRRAADAGAEIVFLPELTLSRYPAYQAPAHAPVAAAEDLLRGPTMRFAREAARRHGVFVHASLFEDPADGSPDGLGLNTAILVAPDGDLVGRTRKLHIPFTDGYVEDRYFRPGPALDAYPVYEPAGLDVRVGLPTCWDQWFPEVARIYALGGADLVAYPSAIGSEPDHPDFDTQPIWHQVIIGHAIANGLFVVVPNRTGREGDLAFYGSSFIADPYGRVLAEAPRNDEAVLVSELDLDQRRDWLTLFPLLQTRRPDTYAALSDPRVRSGRTSA